MHRGPLPFAVLVPCALLVAQDPAREADALLLPMVEQKLASDVAADVAWGGQLVWQHRLRAAGRALGEALARWRDRDGFEARLVRLHLLDGMLGAGSGIPAEQVEFLLDDALTRPVALALIADDWRNNAAALQKIAMAPAPEGDMARIAAARLVVIHELHSVEFTKHLLDGLSATMWVYVRDARTEDGGQWNSVVGFGGPDVMPGVPAGFPPRIRHELTGLEPGDLTTVERSLVPTLGSMQRIQLLRNAKGRYGVGELNLGTRIDRLDQQERTNLLRAMAAKDMSTRTHVWHDFRDAGRYLAEVTAARDAQRKQLDDALQALRLRRWLGQDDLVGFRLPLEVQVQDKRGDKSIPLPELPPLPELR